MRALCYKCGYGWNYKGKQRGKDHLSCPKCSYRLVAEKTIVEDSDMQKRLHSFPLEIHKKPKEIHTYIHNKKELHNFIEVERDIFVEKKIAKQFKECQEEVESSAEAIEETPGIKILPPKFEIIRIIPRDPIKLLEHMKNYYF